MCQKRNKVIKNILFVSVLGVLLLIYQLNFKIIMIDGPSMSPTYQDHQLKAAPLSIDNGSGSAFYVYV